MLPRIAPGGADRDRTDDLKLAKLALSQLSYGPNGVETPPPDPIDRPSGQPMQPGIYLREGIRRRRIR
jgi:hypothetical protein